MSFPKTIKVPLNKPLKVLLATNSLILLATAMVGPIYALFVENVGGNLLDASFAGGVYAVAAGITTLLSGKITDRIKGKEVIIVLGYILIALVFFFYIFVNSITTLLLAQIVLGLGNAIYSPTFDALYSVHLDEHKEGVQWGTWESMYYFTTASGAFLGGLIVSNFGFKTLFMTMSLLCLASAIYIWKLPRRLL